MSLRTKGRGASAPAPSAADPFGSLRVPQLDPLKPDEVRQYAKAFALSVGALEHARVFTAAQGRTMMNRLVRGMQHWEDTTNA